MTIFLSYILSNFSILPPSIFCFVCSSLYRGLLASALGIIPYAATNYYTYDFLRRKYKSFKRRRLDKYYTTIGTLPTLVIGSMSGAIAASVTFPLEVVRRQLQAGALPGKTAAYSSMGDCVMGIMRERVRLQ